MKLKNAILYPANILALFSIACILSSCKETKSPYGYYHNFDIVQLADSNRGIAKVSKGEGFTGKVLKISPTNENRSITIWKKGDPGSFEKANFLVYEVWHNNNYCGYLSPSFYGTSDKTQEITFQGDNESVKRKVEGPKITTKIGVLPRLKTKVIYPLKYLNGQTVFGQRFPRQLKTNSSGERISPEDITKVVIRLDPYMEPRFKPEFEIAAIYLTDSIPPPFAKVTEPYVDEFGQWALKDWPGKTRSVEELKAVNDSLLNIVSESKFKDGWSKYGGMKSLKFKATGFFRTHNDGKRWWLVDPEGYAFVSVGVDCLRSNADGYVSEQEDLFKWLPDQVPQAGRQRNFRMVDFYSENLKRVFGNVWKERWDSITGGLLRQYNFNTVGNWSDIAFAKKARLPYVFNMDGFPSTGTLLYRDFPDVFSTEYAERSKKFAAQMEKFKSDPLLIGYFLRNEPTWAFGYHNIAFEMFTTRTASATKDEFLKWISVKYKNDLNKFNTSWGLALESFEALKDKTFKTIPNKNADTDFYAFSEIMVMKYISVPCDEIDKIDPAHLNLGLRYGSLSSDLLYNASERFDVFSINSYGRDPAPTLEIAKRSGKPVMIGEFHFGAVDRGLPATGLGATVNQADRGRAYQHYIETGFARPELIAIHWFTWIDQPVTGRFDGENYNIGMVDICNRPYRELMDAARISNGRVYEVATGKIKPFDEHIEKVPLVR
jgi:hypothetical protein